jgi:hypothetical protein
MWRRSKAEAEDTWKHSNGAEDTAQSFSDELPDIGSPSDVVLGGLQDEEPSSPSEGHDATQPKSVTGSNGPGNNIFHGITSWLLQT